jgi:hypothetical protein
MFRAATGFGNERHDICECLMRLRNKISTLESLLGVPADLAGEKDHTALGDDAVGEALGWAPAARMKKSVSRHLRPPHDALKRNEIRLNRHSDLACCLSMISSENRYPLFGIMLWPLGFGEAEIVGSCRSVFSAGRR